ncbi:MAG: hypothetical protein DRI90_23755 [Deltaproteobacteria bacterium]|nr:MAG: hypothetical protein DRI90_23755 [Deltaproteobacteria bacterium]
MAQSHGRQKRAAKQKKRRQARKEAKARQAPKPEQRRAEPPKRSGPHGKPLHAELAAEIGYDANRVLGSQQWLALDEREQLARVATYHERALPSNQQPPSIPRHAGMHVIVENQLASGEPPETSAALQRLFAEGLSRHDALHAIGWVLTEHMGQAMKAQEPVDAERYAQDLSQLTVDRWLSKAADKP